MYQAPAAIWNEIAQSQQLRHRAMQALFLKNPDELEVALGEQDRTLSLQGLDSTTIRAYHLTAPLLLENEAISRYIQQSSQPFLRNSLPELTTVNEAISLATAEYSLTTSQTRKLRQVLEAALKTR